MTQEQLIKILEKHIPPSAAPRIAQLLIQYQVRLIIKWERASKLGDYRPPFKGSKHQITINNTLNVYAFLLTLTHELAHLVTHVQYGHRVQAHGAEWKQQFIVLMNEFLNKGLFPPDVERAIKMYLSSPKASSCADPTLMRVLNKYNEVPDVLVEQLPENTLFAVDENRVFKKGKKRRKNFECVEIQSQRVYLVSGTMAIRKIIDPAKNSSAFSS